MGTGIEESIIRREVDSHSSALTNRSIKDLLDINSRDGYDLLASKPNPTISLRFFSGLIQSYQRVKDLFNPKTVNEKIGNKLIELNNEGYTIILRMRKTGKFKSIDEIEELNRISFFMQNLMITGLQNLNYFFRIGTKEPKGIDEALKIFDRAIWKPKHVLGGGKNDTGKVPSKHEGQPKIST